jgi:N-acetylglucosaminyldiphosphoundecaprenol N-acetyl-beta-D-mannosaminyltransferase
MMERVSLLGTGVHALDMGMAIEQMQAEVESGRKGYISLAPAHNLMAARADAKLRAAMNQSTLTVPDGMGTVWFLRLLGHKAGRVYGPDLMLAAAKHGEALGWRHLLVGGSDDVAVKLQERLSEAAPRVAIAGVVVPPFSATLDDAVLSALINSHEADIVWVALGSPRQELWMVEIRPQLKAALLVGVGAAFDFLSGAKPQAPVWMQRTGTEWLFRLFSEPRRLWRRYASYPLFVILAAGQLLGLSRYPMKEAK